MSSPAICFVKMPHQYNRKAFLKASQTGDPLLESYCLLVVIELAIKDHLSSQTSPSSWMSAHDIPGMLAGTGDPTLDSYATQLIQSLQSIPCTSKGGGTTKVPKDNYPYLRYIRHDDDYRTGLNDNDLSGLVQLVRDIIAQLRSMGIPV